MTAMETAEALSKLLATPLQVEKGVDAGIRELGRELGKSEGYIRDHLNLLKQATLSKRS